VDVLEQHDHGIDGFPRGPIIPFWINMSNTRMLSSSMLLSSIRMSLRSTRGCS